MTWAALRPRSSRRAAAPRRSLASHHPALGHVSISTFRRTEGASGPWEVLCMPPIQEAFRISDHLPEDAGLKMSQSMIKGGWRNLTCVWEADKSAPKLQALWRLCGHCPTPQVQAVVYAFVKASFDVRCPRSAPLCPPLSVLPSHPPQASEECPLPPPFPGSLRRQSLSITNGCPSKTTRLPTVLIPRESRWPHRGSR